MHRRRFVVRRCIRRILLGELTCESPDSLQFIDSGGGKPRLATAKTGLEFSSSHGEEWGLIATHTDRIGADIETLARPVEYLRFAEHHFTPGEFDEIRRYEGDALRQAFFNCWTGKEAYVKALGRGLHKPLKSFAVHCRPGVRPGLLFDSENPDTCDVWKFERFSDGEAVATVAALGDSAKSKLHVLSAETIRRGAPVKENSERPWQKS